MADEGGAAGLEQFCLLAKTAKGRACVALVQQVLGNKKIFVFGELLAMPNVQALRGTEHEPYLRLLEIFAYKTYADYRTVAGAAGTDLPALTPPQLEKLRMLSVVSLAQAHKVVPYAMLQEMLGADNVRQLEDLVFDTVYAGLVQGKLDQRQAVLKVKYAMARDVRLEDVDAMLATLGNWASSTQKLIATLDKGVEDARLSREGDAAQRKALGEEAERARKHIKDRMSKKSDDPGYDMGFDDMDVDRPHPGRKGRSKRRGPAFSSEHRPRNK